MDKIYFTLTGTKHYYGSKFMEPGMRVFLEKEPDNSFDKEAIQVKMEGIGKVGYVANSSFTVIGEAMSAGRLYDKIGDTAAGKIILVTDQGVLCKIGKKSLLGWKKELSVREKEKFLERLEEEQEISFH